MICIDDFGNEVHRCFWTGKLVSADIAVITGGFMPGVKSQFIAHPDHHQAKRDSYIAFADICERNCNTCKHLERAKQEKNRAGFLYGFCKSENSKKHTSPYADREKDGLMVFHPDDPMHMDCYESRFNQTA